MTLTLKQITELPLKERRQLGACINYFMSKEYSVHKRRKCIMKAKQELEHEPEHELELERNTNANSR